MTQSPVPLLLHVFPSFNLGGAQVRFAAIANRYGRAFRHLIVGIDGTHDCREKLDPGLDVSFLDVTAHKGDMVGNVRRYRRVLNTLQPDLLVTSNWGSLEWAIGCIGLPGIRHVHTEDGFGPEELNRQLARRVWGRRLILRRSTVVVPSRTLRNIARTSWRISPGRLRYIPNGVDLARFAAPGRRANTNGIPVIGTVAGLRAEKNVARLLRAFALARKVIEVRLVIVGDGEQRAALETLAMELGVMPDVSFRGRVHDPAPLYGGFDLFALSSDTEQMPLSVLEAMGAGLAIAATDVGDVAEMVTPANRPFITPVEGGEHLMSQSILALLSDPCRRLAIGNGNRVLAETVFDQDVMFRAYAELFAPSRVSRHPAQYTEAINTAAQAK